MSDRLGRVSVGGMVVLGIVALALFLALYSWHHQWQRGRQALRYWGDDAVAIRIGTEVAFAKLTPIPLSPETTVVETAIGATSEAESGLAIRPGRAAESMLSIGGRQFRVSESTSCSDWPGMINWRQALIEDQSYRDFTPVPLTEENEPDWSLVFYFRHEQIEAAVGVAVEEGVVARLASGEVVQLTDFVARGLRKFLAEHDLP